MQTIASTVGGREEYPECIQATMPGAITIRMNWND